MGNDVKTKKEMIPVVGKITSIGYNGDTKSYDFYVSCPWDDNPQLEDPVGGSSEWLSCVVQVTFIRRIKHDKRV